LQEYRCKLNSNKCVFGVPSGKLLSFIISHRGIEANPEKISDITNMKAPTCIKDVHKLTGCMVALNRFISKLGERGLPFFKLLKHQEKFAWTPEADQALAEGPIRRTREGGSEWEPIKILLEGDGNSNKMNTASNTRLQLTTKVGQAHVATGVPLDLGTNTPPSDPRNAAEKPNLEPTDPHRSDR
jgi:hypothetical protein